jgi:hypothetical protein
VPHAHHFLERLDRVTREQVEFALGLYRDHEAVRSVLDHVNLPPAAERVALALDVAREGPFAIVTRDGQFVTCLGKGMRHDHPVVPRGQLDALLGKVADKRALRELAQRDLRPDEDEDDLFQRALTRGSRLSREDFAAISAFGPALGASTWDLMIEIATEIGKSRLALLRPAARTKTIDPALAHALEALDRLEWAVAHLSLLSCAGDRSDLDAVLEANAPARATPSMACSLQTGLTFSLRAAWVAARLGRNAIPRYKRELANANTWEALIDAGLGLGAIALRHSGATNEIQRFLSSYEKPRDGEAYWETARASFAASVAQTIADPAPFEEAAFKIGRHNCQSMGEALPEGNSLRFARPEDVPEGLARTAALTFDVEIYDPELRNLPFIMLPVAACATAEDFYFPRHVVRAWRGAWMPEETLERLARLWDRVPKTEPVRSAKTPGRNDPCSCGSGKKWKKCHGSVVG